MGDKWSKALWKVWLWAVGGILGLSLALFGIFERTTLSPGAWDLLSRTYPRPLWSFVLAILATALVVSAAFILVMQVADSRHDKKMKRLTEERASIAGQLENLEGLFRDKERLRMIDPITGVPNYQSWEDDLKKWVSLRRGEKTFSLILIDMDNLRWLNRRSRACADEVLRFFARSTYDAMRRDEQVYKAPELKEREDSAEMYRHYQGGDEFFFIVSGDVYEAVGFVNRLAGHVGDYGQTVREKILPRYTSDDVAAFQLSFSASIAPILPGTEPSTALPNAYSVLGRAKESAHSRLLVVFDKAYEHPASHREELEKDLHGVQAELEKDPDSVRADAARAEIRKLEKRIDILTKAELLFAPKRVNLPLAT